MRRIIIATICFLSFTSASSQNRTSMIQRINEIKNQSDIYHWDQYTCPEADSAKVNATKRLLLAINLERGNADNLTVDDVMPYVSYINIDRGNMKQYFAYIKKTDAANIRNKGTLGHQPVQGSNNPEITPTISSAPKVFVPDAFVQRMMETRSFMNAYQHLKSLQAQGQVLQFGKLRDVEDYSSFDLVLFDMSSQQIITMLSAEDTSGKRTNLMNGTEDSLDNYPTNMTAVIWYIRK